MRFLQRLLWEQATVVAYLWTGHAQGSWTCCGHSWQWQPFLSVPMKSHRLTQQWPVVFVGCFSFTFSFHIFLGRWHF